METLLYSVTGSADTERSNRIKRKSRFLPGVVSGRRVYLISGPSALSRFSTWMDFFAKILEIHL